MIRGPWKMHREDGCSLKSQREGLLLPDLPKAEMLPAKAVCHQAGQPGIAAGALGPAGGTRGFCRSSGIPAAIHVRFAPPAAAAARKNKKKKGER